MFDTIAAISSGNTNQAISIIRIVGPEALKITKEIFTGKIGGNKTISFGYIKNEENKKIDEVLVNFFIGNENFVGEDTVEINAHGGIVITKIIYNLILSKGARPAAKGEFTRRAFLNNKISLEKAEAINELIMAKTNKQAEIAFNSFESSRNKEVENLRKDIEYLIGLCEVNIDYPEYEDVSDLKHQDFISRFNDISLKLKKISESIKNNQVFIKPLSMAIVGMPNAGKSAFLNSLIGEQKSIVTNIAGTTRDVVESEIILNNVIVKLKDTAGIRKSKDIIEKIGIEKSFKEIQESEIILHIIDSSKGERKEDLEIKELSKEKIYFQLWNKEDLLNTKEKDLIYISAKNNNIEDFKNKINSFFENFEYDYSFSFSERVNVLLLKTYELFKIIKNSLNEGHSYDVIILDLNEAWDNIASITGESDKEKLLDSIFDNFCLGK